jgi:hypothetical protein
MTPNRGWRLDFIRSLWSIVSRLGSYDWSDILAKALNRFCDLTERKSADVDLRQKTIMVEEFILSHNLVDYLLRGADHQLNNFFRKDLANRAIEEADKG